MKNKKQNILSLQQKIKNIKNLKAHLNLNMKINFTQELG